MRESSCLFNVRSALPSKWPQFVAELRQLGAVPLATYLHETGLDLEDLYRNGHTWTELRRAAGMVAAPLADGEMEIGRGLGRLLHVDDLDRLARYKRLLHADEAPVTIAFNELDRRALHGLLLTILSPRKGTYADLDAAARALWHHGELRRELIEFLDLLDDQVTHLTTPLSTDHRVPLAVHASYTREEILAAFGASTVDAPLPLQTGVYWHAATQTVLLFITLQKTERDYSPTTRYLDYAVSDRLFHWESQANTATGSETGQRYVHHINRGVSVVLFIRQSKNEGSWRTMPYFNAGTATYVDHRNERPMQVTWRLNQPLPGDTFASYRAAIA